ncbi:hypothetical protein B0H13DRAFT_156594 [Mycena leptocephala]|nr:hypothetical protein B0H13DRAFT_156594 [Mycena leptocephala]
MSALFGVLFFHTPILAQSIRPSAPRSNLTIPASPSALCDDPVPLRVYRFHFHSVLSPSGQQFSSLPYSSRSHCTPGCCSPYSVLQIKISCVYTLLGSHSSPCLFDLTAYNHLKLQCMCDGPPSCTNRCPATMPAATGCRIGSSISADHRNMHYSRSVRRPSHKVLCDSTSTTTQFLHPMTPLLLCRRWLPGLAGSPCATHTAI